METRYERQIMMDEIGVIGQDRLKASKVLVVGAGGLGSPVLTYLVAAGVGRIHIIDNDLISTSNLNRQFLYGPMDVGRYKAEIAAVKLSENNPEITVSGHTQRLNVDNVDAMLTDIDVVVDCVDNVETRLILNKACLNHNIPLVEGGVEGFYGFVTVIGRESACLECMGYSATEAKGPSPVIGVTAGVIGCIQAQECIKLLLGLGSELYGASLQYDGIKQRTRRIPIHIDANCKLHTSNERR